MSAPSTRQVLMGLIEDVEIITKEMFDGMASRQRSESEPVADTQQLLDLLIKKDEEIQETLKTASEQNEIQNKMSSLQMEVDKRDHDILQLQKNLKEAENLLATAIYQAKQKLTSIKQANQNAIPEDELIRYAHKISSSNAVAAPSTWQPGDVRRPYPTEMDMRLGFLGRMHDPAFAAQPSLGDPILSAKATGQNDLTPTTPAPQMPWQPPPDLASNISMPSSVSSEVRGQNKENEDVEVMSTDSSSSSSSDE